MRGDEGITCKWKSRYMGVKGEWSGEVLGKGE
jgi:hypothetical protein